jgi:hypothetical protein
MSGLMSFATGATKTWFGPALRRGLWLALSTATLVGCFQLVARETSAAFIQPTTWTRPASSAQATSDRTTYQSYDVFTTAAGPNTPDIANINPNGTANAYDTSGGSFITSGGNIYSFSVPTLIEATVPNFGLGSGFVTNVLLQVRTLGSVVDTNSIKLIAYSGNAGNPYPTATAIAPASQQLLLDEPDQSGFGGTDQEWAFSFSIAGNAASYKLAFNASASSVSLDQLSIDTQAARLPGDFNLDGHLNAADVLAATAALADLGRYQATNHLSPTEMLQIGI